MHDLVIRNGTIVDGTGSARRMGDVAIDHGRISAVGPSLGRGRREIDAQGLLVAPGWVDIHTHYDGQATWDSHLTPSCWHGVTSTVMGNCGVGFAPVKPDRREWLIELMEGVEDIPGSALAEGIVWEWETFPEYLDALGGKRHAMDIGTQVPHGAVRAYVMGERGARNQVATAEDIAAMAAIVRDGLKAGALGFSTSRTRLHLAKDGEPVPGTFAHAGELLGIGAAMAEAGHGVFEMASDMTPKQDEFVWMRELSRRFGVPVTYPLLQSLGDAESWRDLLRQTEEARAEGARIVAQVAPRPAGLVLSWQGTLNPFIARPSYRAIAHLPFAERLVQLRDPAVRARITAEKVRITNAVQAAITQGFDRMFRLEQDGVLDYEPPASASVAAVAARSGRTPDEVAYDMLMENDGRGYIYLPLLNYTKFDLDHIQDMLNHPATILSLSDGGAHCGAVCDASYPTYVLSHWVRDRTRGGRLALEQAVAMQTRNTARLYGMYDRGVLAPGMKADINLIDFDRLRILAPEMVFDLPGGARRMIQRAEGYRATIVSGEVTFQDGEATGALPGRLIRGPQAAPV